MSPEGWIWIYARPLASYPFAKSTRASICFLGISPNPVALIALTDWPSVLAGPLNTTKSISLTMSDTSFNSIPKRISGLSEPNLSIASLHVILLRGSSTLTPKMSLKILAISLSVTSITSSASTKDISKSTWVNSGCLSALKSSSLKHLAICIYLSKPAHISICLNNWGDCGSA